MVPRLPVEDFKSRPRVILVVDLAGYARHFRVRSDVTMAQFLDLYYSVALETVEAHGGRVIKFMGDATLAVFPAKDVSGAIASAVSLDTTVPGLAERLGISLSIGANIHLGPVIEAEFGQGSLRRLDAVGRAVNQTFLMGRGPGIRVSEPAYRKLPKADKAPWEKHRLPAVYVLGESDELYAELRRAASNNALRW